MTIKQQGGIFGRNPTFNDLTVEGTFTTSGETETSTLTVSSLTETRVPFAGSGGTLTDDQDLSFSGNVLTVKGTGTQQLDVRSRGSGYGQAGGINIYGNNTDTDGLLISKSGSGSGAPVARADIINQANSDFRLGSNNTPHMTIKGGGDVQLLTGNLVVTSGKGIDFSATSGTGTSELFDDYEEGTWTATLASGATTTPTATGYYTKVGNVVSVQLVAAFGSLTVNGTALQISGLPFASAFNVHFATAAYNRVAFDTAKNQFWTLDATTTALKLFENGPNASTITAVNSQASGTFTPVFDIISFVYRAA